MRILNYNLVSQGTTAEYGSATIYTYNLDVSMFPTQTTYMLQVPSIVTPGYLTNDPCSADWVAGVNLASESSFY